MNTKFRVIILLAGLMLFPEVSGAGIIKAAEFDLVTGYRQDRVQWSIAGNSAGTNPNILSELTWDDLRIFQIQQRGLVELGRKNNALLTPQLVWLVSYGQIYSGKNQDSDYGGDNRTLEWSRSNNSANRGSVLDLSAGIGLKIAPAESSFSLAPRIGLSLHQQNLRMSNGNQTLSDQTIADAVYGPGVVTLPATGPFAGLDSRYDAEWKGGWLGLELQQKIGTRLTLVGELQYHQVIYTADANWNLRTDLAHPVSFHHDGDGDGLVYELGGDISLGERWRLTLRGNYQQWVINSGRDTIYFANGTKSQTRLQEVSWRSYAFMVGVGWRF